MITHFHLLLDQVLSLDERTNKLVSLFSLKVAHFILVNNVGNLELLFLSLKLVLLVNKFLSLDALLIVQIQEYT